MASLQEKTAFFDQLNAVYSDDEFDSQEQADRARCRSFFAAKPNPPPVVPGREEPIVFDLTGDEPPQTRANPRRVKSAPTPAPGGSSFIIKGTPMANFAQKGRRATLMGAPGADAILVDDTPIPESTRKGLFRSGSTPALLSRRSVVGRAKEDSSQSPSTAALKKRKREASSFKLRPEGEQIFRGLVFFYVPDNDIAPARRLRITRAREFGATWTRTVGCATHVVVEKKLSFKDVGGILQRANKAAPPVVVNEDYPIDCIQFKALLQTDQKKYQLAGQALLAGDDGPDSAAPAASESTTTTSLQLKPAQINPKRWDYVPPRGTSTEPGESSQQSLVPGTPMEPRAVDVGETATGKDTEKQGATGSGSTSESTWREKMNKAVGPTFPSRPGHKDELSDYMTIMQEYKGIPLDVEDDDAQSTGNSDMDESGSEDERAKRRKTAATATRKLRSGRRKEMTFEDRFACNSAGVQDAGAGNPNTRTMEVLQLMADYYNRVDDGWRTNAYRRAISTLKRQETKVTTEEEALRLPGIGRRLAQKIEEIATTDRLQRLEYARDDDGADDTLQLFLGVYGAGTAQARKWMAQGFRTLEDLLERGRLTANQRVGVHRYDDLNTRIPRREVEGLGEVVKRVAGAIDKGVEIIIGGSYRRGAESSGDIDLIVTRAGTESTAELKPFLDKLVQHLEKTKFLVARLASSRSGHDGSKWHGCCVMPSTTTTTATTTTTTPEPVVNDSKGTWRRIDFLLVPSSQIGAALLYFTGNDLFNRSMRLLASKKGMRLNQRGLYQRGLYRDVMRGPGRAKVTEGELVEGRDEGRIFEVLGVKWREPHERWC